VIDYIADVRDIVSAVLLDGHIPTGIFGLERRHEEPLTGAQCLETARRRLSLCISSAAVQVENQRQTLTPVIARWNEKPVGPLPLPRHELLPRHPRLVTKVAG
jgi:hypothetical protein